MPAAFFEGIVWHRPWLQPFQAAGKKLVESACWREALNAAAAEMDLRNHRNLPIRFVPQADLPHGESYEAFISDTGCVPTRENLHDFFNALVWLRFPKIKRQLNALQAAEIERAGGVKTRGRVRDAATIFDENATLLVSSNTTWLSALRAHHWQETLFNSRSAFGCSIDIFLFGHALMEKLVTPYKAITAHAWIISVDAEYFALPETMRLQWLDTEGARQLCKGVTTSDFTPLPVLGVPGWSEVQDQAFYADTSVFRPKRI